jgi:hypothetical protein
VIGLVAVVVATAITRRRSHSTLAERLA